MWGLWGWWGWLARRVAVALLVGVVLAVGSVPAGTGVRLWRESRPLSAGAWPLEQGFAFVKVSASQDAAGLPVDLVFVVAHDGSMVVHPVTLDQAGVPRAVHDELCSRRLGYHVYWAGFPFTAAVGWRWYHGTEYSTDDSTESDWLVHNIAPSGAMRWAIPVRPLWSGLLGNVVVYAAGAFVLIALPGWWRRYVRRWEGRCVACGYELGKGVAVCPECGLVA